MAEELTALGLLEQHGVDFTHAGLQIGLPHLGGHGRSPPGPLFLDGLENLLHVRRRGAGTDGVGEDVHLGKPTLADEVQRLGKLLFGLLREAGDHVRGDGRMFKILV